MSSATVELSPTLRQLIDQRLDAIDRVLMTAEVPRGERSNILGDVESHVFDRLAESAADHEPTRRDVLDVLARLDPPEAYAPEEYRERASQAAGATAAAPRMRRAKVSKLAITSMILAACAVPTSLVGMVGVFGVLGEIDEIGLVAAVVAGVPALGLSIASAVLGVLAIRSILRSDGWLYGIGCAIPGVALVPLLMVQLIFAWGLTLATEGIGLVGLAAVYVGATTAFMLHGIWHWLTHDYRVREPQLVSESAENV